MIINSDVLSKIIAGNFELDCPKIILTQNTTNAPNVYKGPGWIYQNNGREIMLKMFHEHGDQEEVSKELKSAFDDINRFKPGRLLSRETSYNLKATDINGTNWSADFIRINENSSSISGNHVIKTNIKQFRNIDEEEDKNEKFFIKLFAFGDFNQYINRDVEINISNYNIKLKPHADYLFITTSGTKQNYEPYLTELIKEALSIFFGRMIIPIMVVEPNGNFNQTIIRSLKNNAEILKIFEPIRISHHLKPEDIQDFLNCYINRFKNTESMHAVFFGYWHKIYQSYKGSIGTTALCISISIEGILKNFFDTYGLDTKFFEADINAAIGMIKKSKLKLSNNLISHLGKLKSKRQVPKRALMELSEKGFFDKDIVEIWNRLRGKTAHADQLNINEADLQKYLNDTHVCLYLFYQLLFIIIGYKGSFINYAKEGWPDDKC